jgi:hypothetical protein
MVAQANGYPQVEHQSVCFRRALFATGVYFIVITIITKDTKGVRYASWTCMRYMLPIL